MREVSLERAFTCAVRRAGGQERKLVTPGRRHAADRLVLWPAKFYGQIFVGAHLDFVELKKPGQKPRPGQVREHARLRNWGFSVRVIDTHDGIAAYVRNHACS